MKILFALLTFLFSVQGFSQSTAPLYFDKDMNPVSKKKAEFSGMVEKDSSLYKLTCFFMKKKHKIASIAYYEDSALKVAEGKYNQYFINGKVRKTGSFIDGKKSGTWFYYNEDGRIGDSSNFVNGAVLRLTTLNYLDQKQEEFSIIEDVKNSTFSGILYDKKGNIIAKESFPENYSGICLNTDKDCEFPGGYGAWNRYISQAIMKHVDLLTDNDYGTVFFRFVVDDSGNVTEIRPLTMPTSHLAMIAFNALDSGPKWKPATKNGSKVKTIKIQPVTLQQ